MPFDWWCSYRGPGRRIRLNSVDESCKVGNFPPAHTAAHDPRATSTASPSVKFTKVIGVRKTSGEKRWAHRAAAAVAVHQTRALRESHRVARSADDHQIITMHGFHVAYAASRVRREVQPKNDKEI
jgi:hypothetical protein